MNNIQHILQQLFLKESLEDISVEQLEQVALEHPLFAPAHYLLAKKYKDSGNELYNKQIRKTALHFHNPLLLHYHLAEQSTGNAANDSRIASPGKPFPRVEETVTAPHDLIEEVVVNQELLTDIEQPFTFISTPSAEAGDITSDTANELTNDAHPGEIYVTNPDGEALKEAESNAARGERVEDDDTMERKDGEHGELRGNESRKANAWTNEKTSEGSQDSNTMPDNPITVRPLFNQSGGEENGDAKVTFEPFHTVDYFASQGIKINNEFNPEDRLGTQLKSFTEWLKTMRKLPETAVESELENINDREIVSIAAHSLEEKEVVTEAMAEVLYKQGRHEQAADVYRKLSLINPGKSVYFAAKIEALKNH